MRAARDLFLFTFGYFFHYIISEVEILWVCPINLQYMKGEKSLKQWSSGNCMWYSQNNIHRDEHAQYSRLELEFSL